MNSDRTPVIVIGGPTASGKSGLALTLAERYGGVVINADSMQLYQPFRILTARPSAAEEALAPHRLYGIIPVTERMSAAAWSELALGEIRAAAGQGLLPVLVGGSGLYLKALLQGMAAIPTIPEADRLAAAALIDEIGPAALHERLVQQDPEAQQRLKPNDRTRVLRAWEVLQATGRSIFAWQRETPPPPPDLEFLTVVLEPPRPRLYAACDARFLAMLEQGAAEEVSKVASLNLPPTLPGLQALGYAELAAWQAGELNRPQAISKAQQATRNYAKRQTTWFRHQMPDAIRIDPECFTDNAAMRQFYNIIDGKIAHFISKRG
jgi:tRNA dimethylallyltransferase